MENAARSVCEVVEEYFNDDPSRRTGHGSEGEHCRCREVADLKVLVVCGKGNNGGDGLAIARLLANREAEVSVVLLAKAGDLKADARTNLDILRHCSVPITEALTPRRLSQVFARHSDADVVIDAIFGTGFRGKPPALHARAIDLVNAADGMVIAVDIPSGVQADDGTIEGCAVVADVTVTMAILKRGLVLSPGRECCGDVWIGDIGSPQSAIREAGDTFLLDQNDVESLMPRRPASGHKGTFGTALIVAGSPGYTGAACLASRSALRAGCGLSKLALPEKLLPIVESGLIEVVKFGLPQTSEGALSREAWPRLKELIGTADALAIGPGIGTAPETRNLELEIIAQSRLPLIIDADGITNLTGHTDLLRKRRHGTILTPHPGEISRLLGISPAEINAGRIDVARKAARDWNVVLILKGSPTVIASPDGKVYVNSTGNSGLGSGGTGDVLTGMIAGLLAQQPTALAAALTGVYLHGLAGDLAAEDKTEYALIAGDLLDYLPGAIKTVMRRND